MSIVSKKPPHHSMQTLLVDVPVTRDSGRVNGLLSSQCRNATLPARASKSSKSFPVRTFPKASTYKSRRFAVEYLSDRKEEIMNAVLI